MSTPENEIKLNGDVIPFKPKKTVANTRKTTTIAAVTRRWTYGPANYSSMYYYYYSNRQQK